LFEDEEELEPSTEAEPSPHTLCLCQPGKVLPMLPDFTFGISVQVASEQLFKCFRNTEQPVLLAPQQCEGRAIGPSAAQLTPQPKCGPALAGIPAVPERLAYAPTDKERLGPASPKRVKWAVDPRTR
jgi:hypothetical protein